MADTIIQTQWGYDIYLADGETIPAIVSPEQIATASGGRISADDTRLPAVCAAVSAAVRDYCGWHVAPNLHCELMTQVDTRVVMLPAKFVSAIDDIEVSEEHLAASDYEWKRSGAVRLSRCPAARGRWQAYRIEYDAGLDSSITSLGQIAAQIALNNLMAAPGIRNESVGQVSVSYSQMTEGVSGGVQLLERDKAMLAPYRIHPRM